MRGKMNEKEIPYSITLEGMEFHYCDRTWLHIYTKNGYTSIHINQNDLIRFVTDYSKVVKHSNRKNPKEIIFKSEDLICYLRLPEEDNFTFQFGTENLVFIFILERENFKKLIQYLDLKSKE